MKRLVNEVQQREVMASGGDYSSGDGYCASAALLVDLFNQISVEQCSAADCKECGMSVSASTMREDIMKINITEKNEKKIA